jgi:hypothetical protein
MERKHFKTDANHQGYSECHPKMQEVMQFIVKTTEKHGGECIFTETKTTGAIDKALGRVSQSHEQGRAADQRTWILKPEIIPLIIADVVAEYGHLGALTSTGERKLAVHHNSGNGDHIHWQLDRSFAV